MELCKNPTVKLLSKRANGSGESGSGRVQVEVEKWKWRKWKGEGGSGRWSVWWKVGCRVEGGVWSAELENGHFSSPTSRPHVTHAVMADMRTPATKKGLGWEQLWNGSLYALPGLDCNAQPRALPNIGKQSAWTKRQPGPARKFNPGMPGPYALQEALEEANGASMPPAPKSGLGLGKDVTHVQ